MLLFLVTVLFGLAASAVAEGSDSFCEAKSFGDPADSIVCVCTADYCDYPGTFSIPPEGEFTTITSTRDGLRFHVDHGEISSTAINATVHIHVNHGYEYQNITGFGGAFTDAGGINIASLPEATQDVLMKSYFSPEGIEYSVGRIPMAGSDFSTRPYSYDDVEGDVDLEHFSLTDEDYNYKIPYLKKAIEYSGQDVYTFGSPWSPPAWMKENGMFNGSGGLLPEMRQPYSNYFVKFVQAYEAEGIPLWGLTTQNEPLTGFEDWFWNTCAWSAEDMRDWIKHELGPTLEAADMRRLKLMVLDHNRDALPWYPATILEDPQSNKYVDGIAIHWYADDWVGPSVLDEVHGLFPEKFLMYTESCDGWDAEAEERVVLGAWWRAESYAFNIIEDLNHWATGWVDWNMALDMEGGPNWANNFVDAPIIINKDTGEFYKQPMFYAMGHFSKFVKRGAKRIWSNAYGTDMFRVAAFHNPDGSTVIEVLNMGDTPEAVLVELGEDAGYINYDMPSKSLITILYNTPSPAS